jgi:molybdopterin molybdotransferase
MPEFLDLIPPQEALALFLDKLPVQWEVETIPAEISLGRVTAADLTAPHPLPDFRRSTVDGYAVRARDTHGASESLPAYLELIGEVEMGAAPAFQLEEAQCAVIHTGGMIPAGADAVVMIEETQRAADQQVEIFKPVGVGQHVIEIGEDVAEGEVVIPAGTRIRPAEIGGMMALGIQELKAVVRPRVGIISSGDEVIQPGQHPEPGQVRDINTYTLSSLVAGHGGEPVHYGIIPDNKSAMADALEKASGVCQLVIVTAGSSASARDLTAEVMDELGEPGVLVHGVNFKPGKPTILAAAGETALIGLPGNPVSALAIANLFVVPVLEMLSGIQNPRPRPSVPAVLSLNVSSQSGREDWIAVRLITQADGSFRAEPIFGKSNLIFVLVQADGMFAVPAEANGISAGEIVEVRLF